MPNFATFTVFHTGCEKIGGLEEDSGEPALKREEY